MNPSIIADASCLMGLDNTGRLDLLQKVYPHILIPPAVEREFGSHLDFLEVRAPRNRDLVDSLSLMLGAGESEVIALAKEQHCPVILDDKKARGIAERLGIEVIGTVGVLIKAKRAGHLESIKVALDALEDKAFYISQSVHTEALKICNET